jgi:hypothetical protein
MPCREKLPSFVGSLWAVSQGNYDRQHSVATVHEAGGYPTDFLDGSDALLQGTTVDDAFQLSRWPAERSGTGSNAIVVLTITPSDDLLEFYSGFMRLGCRVFVVIDDNNFKFDNAATKAKNAGVVLLQFGDYECRRAGFFNFHGAIRKSCTAWSVEGPILFLLSRCFERQRLVH